ncbi:Pick C1-like protein 1 [Seminavis robusta]|uniref:Pick C1-like protein 1 n=1 Tax=Seminavis robusta TaxID=568900 RepID=A0A9N8ENI3_9STRA|nr:Pick C1-like protein 1 [Seminavis robusta]|eukprot:Sro1287_g259460.1 Pick C1-like protein 1 (1186) ;mRNA; r:9758-13486
MSDSHNEHTEKTLAKLESSSEITHGEAQPETVTLDGAYQMASKASSISAATAASLVEYVTASHSSVVSWWNGKEITELEECAASGCGPIVESSNGDSSGREPNALRTHQSLHQLDGAAGTGNSEAHRSHEHRDQPHHHVRKHRQRKQRTEQTERQEPEGDRTGEPRTQNRDQGFPQNQTEQHTDEPLSLSLAQSQRQSRECLVDVEAEKATYWSALYTILETQRAEILRTTHSTKPNQPVDPSGLIDILKDPSSVLHELIFDKEDLVRAKKGTSVVTTATANLTCTATDTDSSSSGSSPQYLHSQIGNDRHQEPDDSNSSCRDEWAGFVRRIGKLITIFLTACAGVAARNPHRCIAWTTLLSLTLVVVGCLTNFTLVLDNTELWPPHSSFAYQQMLWFYDSDFNFDYRNVDLVIHAEGANVLTQAGVSRVFEAMSVVQGMENYQEGCRWAELVGDSYHVGECHEHSVTDFWNRSNFVFEQETQSDEQARLTMSVPSYPSGETVDLSRIIGNAKKDKNGTLTTGEAFLVEFDLPWSLETAEFELIAVNALLELKEKWKAEDSNPFRLEVVAYRSYEDEFMRAIILDLPLLPAVFVVVCLFCCLVFWRYDKVHSRCLLGIGAVVCILLSIMASHGLMFLCGVPFTTSTSMLPFLMFGIGLDDAFVIIGSYNRTRGTDIEKRIQLTMEDISLSIGITTLTSSLAFALGIFSDIPSVRWLCLYACPSILIDFAYQITFFIALIVLDERRIQDNRRDGCAWIHVEDDSRKGGREAEDEDDECGLANGEDTATIVKADAERIPPLAMPKLHWSDRFMAWYADKLLHPISQTIVLVGFVTLLGVSLFFITRLEQHFDMNDMVPHDSYLRGYYSSLKHYSNTRNGIASYAFFRDIDQSDPQVQTEMLQFVDELADGGAIASYPANCWLPDFLQFTNTSSGATNLSFTDQVELFLQEPVFNMLYDDHIVRTPNGSIAESRCEIYVNVDISDAQGGTAAFELLRNVSRSQAMNQGLGGDEWHMFTYHDMYNLWEFYKAVVAELSVSTIMGIAAVSIVALFLIPHWSAVFFVTPLIICLYIDLLGYITYAKVHVNAISYVQLVMSIGLMVDFIMHILIRYYESEGSRRVRVKHTLTTMGSSVFVGGVSSLLGVSLLAFSTSEILQLVFVAVLGLVVLGIVHGLVFLPVILSLIGPE